MSPKSRMSESCLQTCSSKIKLVQPEEALASVNSFYHSESELKDEESDVGLKEGQRNNCEPNACVDILCRDIFF